MSVSDSSNKIIYAGDGHTTGFAITMPLPGLLNWIHGLHHG
jgi:hypothetical protein